MASPFCVAMEQGSQSKDERKAIFTEEEYYNIGIAYLTGMASDKKYDFAISYLDAFLFKSDGSPEVACYFDEFIKYVTMAAQESFSPAERLLSLFSSLGSLDSVKITLRLGHTLIKTPSLVNTQSKSYVFLALLNYMLKRFDTGFHYLIPLLESQFDVQNLLLSVFEDSPDAVGHFVEKLNDICRENHKNRLEIEGDFLDQPLHQP